MEVPTPAMRALLVGYSEAEQAQLAQTLDLLGYESTAAESESEAGRIIRREKLAVVLLNVLAADHQGTRSLRQVTSPTEGPAVIIVTAVNDAAVAAACFRDGASDYLLQPVDPAALGSAVQGALERQQAAAREARVHEVFREELSRLAIALRRAHRKSAQVSLSTLGSLVSMMEIRDRYLAGHSVRVAQLAASMAAELQLPARDVEQVRAAGRLHDIGMLCVAEGILSKAGPLTAPEFERVKQHVVIADQILSGVPQLDRIRAFVRSHHERWDGAGYPDGLSGEAIPWGSRLIATAEIYDALTTSRPYKSASTPDEAIERMAVMSGGAVAPEAYEGLVRIVRDGRALVFIDGDDPGPLLPLETADGVAKW
jgi:response regulator RpfG family c-di-GMP phosphodiesterase